MPEDFSSVTELPGSPATREQSARLYHRYHTAADYSKGKRVLEAACGAGMGLGYLAARADMVVGGDLTEDLLQTAQAHYQGRTPLVRLDAHGLPFRAQAFDLVILFEAIYYLARPELFLAESRRVLSKGGLLLICTVNKDWSEFTPSRFSARYFSVPELSGLLGKYGFADIEIFGAFPASAASPRQKVISLIRRLAAALHLIPQTLGGRERLKRLFYGHMEALKPEVEEGMAELFPLVKIPKESPSSGYKIIYAKALAR